MPQRFPFFDEMYITPNKYHKMFVEKWYLILYQIQDDTVYVEYILDWRIIVGSHVNNYCLKSPLFKSGGFFMLKWMPYYLADNHFLLQK